MLVDEIAAYAEQARDRGGVDQFSVWLLLFEKVGDSSSHSLYLRVTQAQWLGPAAFVAFA